MEDCHRSSALHLFHWRPLQDILNSSNPSSLSCSDHTRLAKDTQYASKVLKAWRNDLSKYNSSNGTAPMGSVTKYKGSGSSTDTFHGFLVSPVSLIESATAKEHRTQEVSAVILFHTAAGPQDIFLRWKSDILVRELKNCIVFIADMFSDKDGYAWSDRERYIETRNYLLSSYENSEGIKARWNLRHNVIGAIDHLKCLDFVNVTKIAAMGYCFGGHPILELGLMVPTEIKALITYHGVFDGVKDYITNESELSSDCISGPLLHSVSSTRPIVLIFNGDDDPFVNKNDIESVKLLLENKGCNVTVVHFAKVRHGFTNPAQEYNPSDAFEFSKTAAEQSWDSSIHLLKEVL